MKITSYAVHRQLATSAIVIALVVLGVYGFLRLPVDYLPNVTYPFIRVQIKWPGATPEEIDSDIADVVERFIATVDRLDYIESSCVEGIYALDVNFQYGSDIDVAFQDVLAALTRAQQKLPKDVEMPYVDKADLSQLPVMQLPVSSDRRDPVKLRNWAENWLQDRILSVRGVAGTEVVGGLKREIRVLLDPPAMEKHGLSLDAVIKRIDAENVDQTGGRVTVGTKEIIARTMGEYATVEDLETVVVVADGYQKVYFALFLSFIVLTVQFNSLKLPGLILGSVPVCLAGVVLILFFTGIPLGATVVIGVLVVVAATVNDGVLLLAYARELNEQSGKGTRQSIVDAATFRLRPRIMTTVTTMIGFVPLALNIEEGGDMLQPMAVAAIGGLGMEMLVALFLMPCLYVLLTRN